MCQILTFLDFGGGDTFFCQTGQIVPFLDRREMALLSGLYFTQLVVFCVDDSPCTSNLSVMCIPCTLYEMYNVYVFNIFYSVAKNVKMILHRRKGNMLSSDTITKEVL
jgi:hypothetical protein